MADNSEQKPQITVEQLVEAFNKQKADLDIARKMIDKMAINEARHTVEIAERDVILDNLKQQIAAMNEHFAKHEEE